MVLCDPRGLRAGTREIARAFEGVGKAFRLIRAVSPSYDLDKPEVPMRFSARVVAAAAVLVSASFAGEAFAANKSLAAAKDNLPSDIDIVASADLKGIRATPFFGTILPIALGASGAQKGLDKVKKTCGFDPFTAIDDVTVGLNDTNKGVIFIGMGISESKFTSCVVDLAKQEAGKDVTTSKSGNEITFDGAGKKLFVMWLPGDVAAIASEPTDEATLKKLTGGAGALKNAPIASWLSQTDADAVLLGAVTRTVTQNVLTMNAAMFSVTDKSGNINAKLALDVGSASDAEMAARGAGLLSGLLGPKNPPAELERLIKSLDVKASGSTVMAKASTTEGDLLKIIDWAMKGMP